MPSERHQADAGDHNSPAHYASVAGAGATRAYFFLVCDSMYSNRFLDARDLLRFLVRDFDAELLLERHHELDGVERVGAQVLDERGIWRHLFLVDAQLLHDDALNLVGNGHSFLP